METLGAPMHYFAYGLHIQSDFLLPGVSSLQEGEEFNSIAVTIRRGKCPPDQGGSPEQHVFDLEGLSTLLRWKTIGCFWVRDGREIIVEPAQSVADDLLRSVLLGPVLAMLLFQRGFLVLHASAVALRLPGRTNRAVAFLGHSTHGKSTMATALVKRHHQPLADDTIAVPIFPLTPPAQTVHQKNGDLPLIYPALPHLKLRSPSVQALGEKLEELSLWRPDEDGYVVPLSDHFSRASAPLQCLYILQEGSSIQLEQMDSAQALMSLLDYCYCIHAVPDAQAGDDFLKCAELVRQVPVFRLQRPKDFQLLPEVTRLVEDHQLSFKAD